MTTAPVFVLVTRCAVSVRVELYLAGRHKKFAKKWYKNALFIRK